MKKIAILLVLLSSHLLADESRVEFTTTEGTWISLDVHPGGERLVFELLGDLYELPIDGGVAQLLLSGRAFQSQPRFSPDGTSLTFISDESGSDNVWVADGDGGNARALSDLGRAQMWSPAWSADGASIFVTVTDQKREAEIWSFDVATGSGEMVVANGNGPPAFLLSSPAPGAFGAVSSPDGSAILFSSVTPRAYGSRSGASSLIVRHDLATGVAEPLPLSGRNPMKPELSPDGRHLVYASMSDGKTGLRVRDLETSEDLWLAYPIQRNQLEGRATRDVLPNVSFAPDSESVFAAFGGSIHRLDLDGSRRTVPFEALVSVEVEPRLDFPRRVDDGSVRARRMRHLTFGESGQAAVTSLARIWLLDGDGSPTRLTATERPREGMPAWSPDGRWIAFVTWDEEGGHLWKAPVDASSAPVRLSEAPAFWIDPAWTRDGEAIVAIRAPLWSSLGLRPGQTPQDSALVEVPSDGGSSRTLLQRPGLRHPHFTDGSSRIFLSTMGGLISVGRDGSEERPEARLPRQAGVGEWRISPDGAWLLVALSRGGPGPIAAGYRLLRFPRPAEPNTELALESGEELAEGFLTGFAWAADEVSWTIGRHLFRKDGAGGISDVEVVVETPRARPSGTVVLQGAKVITMRGDEILEDATIVVRDHRIVSVGPREEAPPGAEVFDLSGKVIVPGFIDVHAHFEVSDDLPQPEASWTFANLAFGVTTVRNPQSPADVFGLADILEADGSPAPRVFSTGRGIEIRFAPAPYLAAPFESLEAVRRSLARYRDEDETHLLKSYMAGNRQERQWIVQASRELEMMPTTEGAADTKADLTHAIDGFSGNEHAFPVAPIYDDVVQLVARTGMTYTPTLVVAFGGALPVYRLLAEERPHANPRLNRWFPEGELFRTSSTRVLWFPPEDYNDLDAGRGARDILEAGGNVALGGHGEAQGLSAHWEMALLAAAGMSPHEVLRVATSMGAEAIGYGQDLGRLEPGKLADLVVLDRDPLVDIENTTFIRFVMKNGVLYDAESLDEMWPESRARELPWWLQADRPSEVQ